MSVITHELLVIDGLFCSTQPDPGSIEVNIPSTGLAVELCAMNHPSVDFDGTVELEPFWLADEG